MGLGRLLLRRRHRSLRGARDRPCPRRTQRTPEPPAAGTRDRVAISTPRGLPPASLGLLGLELLICNRREGRRVWVVRTSNASPTPISRATSAIVRPVSITR